MADTLSLAELKVHELLSEVRVDYSATEALERGLAAIRECLLQIPEHEVDASLAPSFVEDLGVPAEKAMFKFKCPDIVEVVGSFAAQTMAKPVQNVDLAIRMPKSCFREKDFLNHRYHVKRALYLAVVRKHISGCTVVRGTKWALLDHDARKPILVVHLGCEPDPKLDFDIHLLPMIALDVFDTSKLAPSRSNVRAIPPEVEIGATPHYSSSILEDIDMQKHCSFLKSAISKLEGLRDTILLSKVWMRQRGFAAAADSLNGFIISMLLAQLTIGAGEGKITSNMNAFQIFRICIEAIASGRVLEKGLFLQQTKSKADTRERQTYFQQFDVIMVDSAGLYNMAFRITKNALNEIKEEARRTIAAMKNSRDCSFDGVFMTAVDFPSKFDYHLRICVPDHPSSACSSKTPFFLDEDKCRTFERTIERILSKGLGDRAGLIRIYCRNLLSSWTIEEGVRANRNPVFAGINVSDFEHAYRMVDIGPSADNKDEAAKFRSFWGEKAELRRFKDGTITETAVWECEPSQRHLIIQKIVEYLLLRHLSLSICDIHFVAGQLDFALLEGEKDTPSFPKLLDAFEIFSKRLRNLGDLPLKISSVQPLSAAFRHAAVFPPEVHVLADERSPGRKHSEEWVASCIDPMEVMVQLEGSGKWPTNQIAIEKTKTAFCLKIAESMRRLYGMKCVAAEDSIDILMHGFCFRLKVYYEKDPTLVQRRHDVLQRSLNESVHQAVKSSDLSLFLRNDLLLQSLHSSMLNGLQGRYPVYGPTVRLAKRWVGCHLFSDVLREEAVELLVAYLFLSPAPLSAPLSQITGFMRFLQLLIHFDWALSPLVVDMSGDLTPKELDFILDEFHSVRKSQHSNGIERQNQQEGPTMFIATPYDLKSRTWTLLSPTYVQLKRIVAYAKTSANLLSKLIHGEMPGRWPSLFRTPLNLYDILLKIDKSKLPHPFRVLFPAEIKTEARVVVNSSNDNYLAWLPSSMLHRGLLDAEKHLLIGFNPTTCLLQDLKMRFDDRFSYWYDSIGSDIIGLTWTRKATQISAKKRKKKDEDLDQESLLEIGEMGEGFLESIHLVSL